MSNAFLSQVEAQFNRALGYLQQELSTLRTGRASAGLLATVTVDSYGASVPLQQVAGVSVSDAKTLTVMPYDPGQLPAIEKGILGANLGVTPANDGKVIRIVLPPPSEERRKELVKVAGQMAEQARIKTRTEREGFLKQMKKLEAEGGVSQDDLKKLQKQLQELVDAINEKIESMVEEKKKEVMIV